MSRFTIKNLMDIEDSAGGRAPGVEGRFARKYLDSEHLGVSYFRYGPGVRSPMAHSHREQEEAYVVVGGSGRIRLDERSSAAKVGRRPGKSGDRARLRGRGGRDRGDRGGLRSARGRRRGAG